MKRLALIALFCACASPGAPASTPATSVTEDTCLAPSAPSPLPGLVAICRDVFVDASATTEERERLVRDVSEARKTVRRLLETVMSERPTAVFCKSEECILRYVGSARRSWTFMNGLAPITRPTIVQVRTDPGVRGVIVHEMLHVETATRVGQGHIPAWFDEGISVSLSGEPDCRTVAPKGIDDLHRLDGYYELGKYTNQHELLTPVYCQAAGEVKQYMAAHGGVVGLRQLLEKVHDGQSFYALAGGEPPLKEATRSMKISQARWGTVHLSGKPDSLVVASGYSDIADPKRAFTIALFMRAEKNRGVLTHVSTVEDPGWCEPFLGFDHDGHLAAQVIMKPTPERSSFAVATDPTARPIRRWTHVAMTWSPGGANRLYIDGTKVAETAAPTYAAARLGTAMDVTWGSNKRRSCWLGALDDQSFEGDLADMNVWPYALDETELRKLAELPPR